MPLGKCDCCGKHYHYAAKHARSSRYYGPDRCFDCHHASPESWARDREASHVPFDASDFRPGHFAALVRGPGCISRPTYLRVRVRGVYEDGTVTTFCGRVFARGREVGRGDPGRLEVMTPAIEDSLLYLDLLSEIEKLWAARKSDLMLSDLVSILDVITERI